MPNLAPSRVYKLSLRPFILRRVDRSLQRLLGIVATAVALMAGCSSAPPSQTTVEGDTVYIDRLYPPGEGPLSSKTFSLLPTFPQKLWLTGADVVVKNAESKQPVAGLLTGLTVGFQDAERHRQLNAMQGMVTPSIFHTGAGMSGVKLPQGYGIPVMSNETLHVSSVWQNRDLYRQPLQARTDVTLHFTAQSADKSAVPALKEVRPYPVYITVPAVPPKGKASPKPFDTANLRPDAEGRLSAGRWWIPPGPSTASSVVSYVLPPEAELSVRLATGFAYEDWTRMELSDLTTETSLVVFSPADKTVSKEFPDGLKLDSRHRLQLSVSYDNIAKVDHVGAAMMVLYCDPVASP